MRWLDGITNLMDMSLSKLQETAKDKGSLACWSPRGCKESDMTYGLNSNKKEGEFIINQFGYFIYTQWQFAESLPETSPIRRP